MQKTYKDHQVSQSSGTPEDLRDKTFATINKRSHQEGVQVDRQIDKGYEHQAKQLLNTYNYQALRTGKVLETNYDLVNNAFRGKVNKHAQDEMGYLQKLATKELYKQFEQKEDKQVEIPEYTAVNLGLKQQGKD